MTMLEETLTVENRDSKGHTGGIWDLKNFTFQFKFAQPVQDCFHCGFPFHC